MGSPGTWLKAPVWVIEAEPQSSTRALSVVDHWFISPALATLTERAAWEKLSIDHILTQASHLYLVPVLKLSLSFPSYLAPQNFH